MTKPSLHGVFARAAAFSAAAAGALALAGLTSWALGQWRRLAFGEAFVPMAPSTGLLLLLLSVAAWLRTQSAFNRTARRAETGCTLLVLAGGAVLGLQSLAGVTTPWEDWLSRTTETVGTIPVGRMSPWTAGCFVLSATALLCGRVTAARWQTLRSLGGALALVVLAVSGVLLIGYLTRTPFFYGGTTIPMALLTALAFVLVSIALLLGAGADAWPLRMFLLGRTSEDQPAGHSVAWSLLGLFLLLTTGIAVAGVRYLNYRQDQAREDARQELEVIANLKVQQIAQWRKGRLTDANLLRSTPYVARRALDCLAEPDSTRTRVMFTGFLQPLLAGGSYERVLLLDARLNVRLVHPPGNVPPLGAATRHAAEQALRTRQVVVADLHRAAEGDPVHLDFVIPLVVRREGTNDNVPAAGLDPLPTDRSAGLLILQVDAQEFLFPLIQTWPAPSTSAETLLVRRDGEEVLFLNELRHRKGTALTLRHPLDDSLLPAAMGLRGVRGVVEGNDYRGERVVAAVRMVPDTPWLMVSKVDTAELYGPVRHEAMRVGALALALLSAAILGISLLWRRDNEHLLRARLQAEQERRAEAERFRHLMQSANDAILVLDEHWRIIESNDRAREFHGYSEADLRSKTLSDLHAPAFRAGFSDWAGQVDATGHALIQTAYQRADGATFPVECSVRRVEVAGKEFRLAIIRDITQRKAHEAEIGRLNRLYATLSQVNESIVRSQTRDALFAEVCRVAVEFGQFRAAWVGWKSAPDEAMKTIAHAATPPHSDGVMPGWNRGCGVIAEVWQTGRPSVCNDARTDARATCCRDALARLGVQSCAAFPLRQRDGLVGVFSICSLEPGFFNAEEIRLLADVSDDVSFALDKLDKETLRQAAEAALRESEAFTKAVLDNLTVGIAVNSVAPTVSFSYMNDSFPQFYRTTREALAAPDAFWETVYEDPAFRETIRQRVQADCASGDPGRMHWPDVPITRKGEPTAYITARNVPLPEKQLMISLVWDVTERKQAEEVLRRREADLQLALEAGRLGDWNWNIVTGEVVWSARCKALYGLPADTVMDYEQFLAAVHPEDRERVDASLRRALESRTDYDVEKRVVWPDGSLRWTASRGRVLLDADGRPLRMTGVTWDITGHKQAELKLAEQLRELQRWHDATLGREGRILALKRQVNELLVKAAQPIRYPSVGDGVAAGILPAESGGSRPPEGPNKP